MARLKLIAAAKLVLRKLRKRSAAFHEEVLPEDTVPEDSSEEVETKSEGEEKERDPFFEESLWNSAALMDSVSVLGETFCLESELNQERSQAIVRGIHSLEEKVGSLERFPELFASLNERLDNLRSEIARSSTPVSAKVELNDVGESNGKRGGDKPKNFDHALVAHLVASIRAEEMAPPVFVDVGAHKGSITKLVADIGASVLAVEPNPSLVQELERRYSSRESVSVLPVALGNEERESDLYFAAFVDPNAQISCDLAI